MCSYSTEVEKSTPFLLFVIKKKKKIKRNFVLIRYKITETKYNSLIPCDLKIWSRSLKLAYKFRLEQSRLSWCQVERSCFPFLRKIKILI